MTLAARSLSSVVQVCIHLSGGRSDLAPAGMAGRIGVRESSTARAVVTPYMASGDDFLALGFHGSHGLCALFSHQTPSLRLVLTSDRPTLKKIITARTADLALLVAANPQRLESGNDLMLTGKATTRHAADVSAIEGQDGLPGCAITLGESGDLGFYGLYRSTTSPMSKAQLATSLKRGSPFYIFRLANTSE